MSTILENHRAECFGAEHFASDYERYAALVLARVPKLGAGLTARLFADWERRELLALPTRAEGLRQHRLEQDEVEPVAAALAERERLLLELRAFAAPVFRNVDALGACLGLDSSECALLVLAAVGESVGVLRDALGRLYAHARDRSSAARIFATLLGQDYGAMHRALAPEAGLARTGLLRVNLQDDEEPLLRTRAGLAALLFDEFDAPQALIARFACPARAPSLTREDFSYLREDIDIVSALLRVAAHSGEAGANIMLYGAPGTGKTELARLLAAQAGVALHEIRHTDADGKALTHARYSQVVVAQRLLRAARGVALLFDETEDLLPHRARGDGTLGKAAFNELLETNAVPMIWISNEIWHIDPAYLRRFAFLLEVKKPSASVRRRIVQRAFAGLPLDARCIERIAEDAEVAPAQITQAARVARMAGAELDALRVAERTLRGSMRALDQRPRGAPKAATQFDLAYLNCNADPAALEANLVAHPAGTLLFYGPPGTGKTALAAHIARAADRSLLTKRASDLLSPWAGACERNIADAFDEARDEGAVLVLDEADSFLADRRDAHARWELTETNELLTQMEQFEGLFVCTTNLLDRLDKAALRRFAVKLRFDYLRPAQARALVRDTLRALGAEAHDASLACLDLLQRLTPGDVAAVVKRCRATGEPANAATFVRMLSDEVALKGGGAAQRIGF